MSSGNQATRLTELIERYFLLKEEGLSVSVEHLCKDNPDLLLSLRQELSVLEKMDRVLESTPHVKESCSELGNRNDTARTTVQFQTGKMLAHGGCSEVYVARDLELERTVAL